MPRNDFFAKQTLFKYYFVYMGLFVATQLINTISYLVSDILCKLNVNNVQFKLHIFYSIGIVSSIFLSYFIVFIRFRHPLLLKKLRTTLGIKPQKKEKNQEETQIPYLKDGSEEEPE